MTDQTAQEPTMEEILASIRRIISEDDAPAETTAIAPVPVALAPEPDPVVDPAPVYEAPPLQQAVPEEDVLELTEAWQAPAAESIGDLDVSTADPDPFPAAGTMFTEAPQEIHALEQPSAPATSYDSLVGESVAASAASAFANFASTIRKPDPMEHPTASGPTVDELARTLLRPMLKEWLDANLPAIVEAQVRKEVERIARTAG